MSIFKSAYDTTACSGIIKKKIEDGIHESEIRGGINRIDTSVSDFQPTDEIGTVDNNPKNDNISAFLHPITIKNGSHGKEKVYVDVRSATRYNDQQEVTTVFNSFEYNFIALRGYLQRLWDKDFDLEYGQRNRELLLNSSKNPVVLFSRWISENISRRFALDPETQLTVMVLAGYYYVGLFYANDEFNQDDRLRIGGFLSRALSVNAQTVIDKVESVEKIADIADFCNVLKEVTQNVRLSELNRGLLYGVVSGGWFGLNAREMLQVALEHPPTWIAVVISAYNDRTYKNSGIGRLAARDNKDQIKAFTQAVFNLIKF